MKYRDKSKDQLLNELRKVQQKYNSLKKLYDTDIIELKKVEQVLKISEERLSLVFNNTSDMQTLIKVESGNKLRIIAVNRSYIESIKQLIFRDALDINEIVGKYRDEALIALGFSKENLDTELQYFLRAIVSGNPIQFEQIVPFGATNIYLESSIVPVTDTKGQCTHLLYSVRNISERKLAEMRLKESEGKYRTLFKNMPIGIGVSDLTGKLVTFNDSILEPGGYSRDDLIRIGTVESLYYNLSDREIIIPLLKEKGTIKKRQIKFKRKDGSPYDALLTLSIIYINDQPMIQAVVEDITERKQAEDSLRLFRTLLDKSNDAIEVIDMQTAQFIDVNERACADLGYSRDELLSMKVFDIDPGQTPEIFQSYLDQIQPSNTTILETIHRRKDGSSFPVEVNIAVVKLEKMYTIAIARDITERKHTETALRESEARFRLFFEISADGISIVDVETKAFIYTNPAVCRMLGYTENELKSMCLADIHPKQDLPWIMREVESLTKGKKSHVLEIPCQRKDGSNIDTEITSVITKIDGRICNVGIHRDITEKKIAENKLRRSEEQLKEAQQVGHIGSWELDPVDNTGTMSAELYKIFDLNSSSIDITIETFLETAIPEDRKMVRELVMKSLKTHEPVDFDFRIITSNKEIHWIHGRSTVAVDEKGNPKRVFGTCQDITERKHAELKLKESERRTRALLDAIPDMIFRMNREGTYLDYKAESTELYVQSETSIIGKMNRDLTPPDFADLVDRYIKQTLDSGELQEFEYQMITHKRGLRDYEARMVVSGIDEVITVVRDITERKRAEEEILLKNAQLVKLNVEKDKFFSIIAHDLRGPLSGLKGLAEILADDSQNITSKKKKELTLRLNQSARNIFTLLENLLEWSQMQRGHIVFKPQMLDLKEVLDECIQIINDSARKKAIEIAVEIAVEQKIFADANMLKTIIRNLVSNAVKFTPKDGKVTISVDKGIDNTIFLAVRDTGIGMNNGMLENLFTLGVEYQRPGTEGERSTGLGLLLCKDFIEKHGGKIWVESQEGKGSVFSFSLPFFDEPEEKTVIKNVIPSECADNPVKKLKILIAEDDNISEKLIALAIKKLAKEILKVRTGIEAVEACRNNPDLDLVLMDIRMPFLDGLEATRQIRQFNKDVIIIAQTAYAFAGDKEKAIESGCTDYISKPINKTLLNELIKKYVNKK